MQLSDAHQATTKSLLGLGGKNENLKIDHCTIETFKGNRRQTAG